MGRSTQPKPVIDLEVADTERGMVKTDIEIIDVHTDHQQNNATPALP